MSRTAETVLFEHIVARDDDDIDLALASLVVGQWEYPALEVSDYIGELETYTETARTMAAHEQGEHRTLRALNRALFEHYKFRGNYEDYYDAKNSFLNEVIDRRLGIPITLSILYLEVGRRLGLEVSGLNFPGHFLVRCEDRDGIVVLDPFHRGVTLDADDLEDRLKRVLGDSAELDDRYLEPTPKRQILARLLGNLSRIYRRDGDITRDLEVHERLVILEPENRQFSRDLERLRSRVEALN